MNDVTHLSVGRHAVDNTDWLKTAAIILVTVDHIGYFFIDQDEWWSVVGRLAAPIFFFLIGYSQTRAVPLLWIGLGVILTLLDSSNHNWTWVAPNILLSFALIRLGRPYAQGFVQRHRWLAFAVLTCMLLALLLPAAKMVDYGAEGWLWALFGLFQRMYVDGKSANGVNGAAQSSASPTPTMPKNVGLIRVLACISRRGRLHLAGTERIFVFPDPVHGLSFRRWHFGSRAVSVPAWPEPHPTARSHSWIAALHWPAHSGDLCDRAGQLRTHCKVRTGPRSLTQKTEPTKRESSCETHRFK